MLGWLFNSKRLWFLLSPAYRFHCSQYIYHCAVQLLAVGLDVPQRVEIRRVLHWLVHQWQQPVDGGCVSTQQHLGMSLCHQQPVVAETADALFVFGRCH